MTSTPTADVPCNGCTRCCQNELLVLHPEMGDDIASYRTKKAINPLTGRMVDALQQKPNGDCTYLGEAGCTIHDRSPAICRSFDCRQMFERFKQYPRSQQLAWIKAGLIDKATLNEGRKRLHSLTTTKERTSGHEA